MFPREFPELFSKVHIPQSNPWDMVHIFSWGVPRSIFWRIPRIVPQRIPWCPSRGIFLCIPQSIPYSPFHQFPFRVLKRANIGLLLQISAFFPFVKSSATLLRFKLFGKIQFSGEKLNKCIWYWFSCSKHFLLTVKLIAL